MKTKINFILAIILVFLITSVSASMLIPANENALENAKAPDKSPVITITDSGNWAGLERIDFIHYAKGENPASIGGKTNTCYKLMGVKWTTLPVSYAINPSNPQGLSESFVTSAISTSAETWDAKTASELFDNTYIVDYGAQYGIQDFKNSIEFGDYPDSKVIAVTRVWYTRVGKRIVEFDQLYDTDFTWGDVTLNPSVMDLQNIATHELGHAVGLNDIYQSSCSYVTMYGYSTEGETEKRTLEQPDITGLQKLYGA